MGTPNFRGENFRGWLQDCEIRECFLLRKFCAIGYICMPYIVCLYVCVYVFGHRLATVTKRFYIIGKLLATRGVWVIIYSLRVYANDERGVMSQQTSYKTIIGVHSTTYACMHLVHPGQSMSCNYIKYVCLVCAGTTRPQR